MYETLASLFEKLIWGLRLCKPLCTVEISFSRGARYLEVWMYIVNMRHRENIDCRTVQNKVRIKQVYDWVV